jgi:hypothetical protein
MATTRPSGIARQIGRSMRRATGRWQSSPCNWLRLRCRPKLGVSTRGARGVCAHVLCRGRPIEKLVAKERRDASSRLGCCSQASEHWDSGLHGACWEFHGSCSTNIARYWPGYWLGPLFLFKWAPLRELGRLSWTPTVLHGNWQWSVPWRVGWSSECYRDAVAVWCSPRTI